jgi:uncharacterized membrane protein YfhO
LLVSGTSPIAPSSTATNQNADEVKFVSYASKHIVLSAKPNQPAILLVNDRFDPNWTVSVDGKPATLLRCNFIMRGVHLEPGSHTVEFRFVQPMGAFYVSLAAVILAGLLCIGLLLPTGSPKDEDRSQPAEIPAKPKLAARAGGR